MQYRIVALFSSLEQRLTSGVCDEARLSVNIMFAGRLQDYPAIGLRFAYIGKSSYLMGHTHRERQAGTMAAAYNA
jgi:hypothetical protein